MRLRCADLFCGAGGFSEGFHQAGFNVTKALDIWAPAVLTHEKNHPDTAAIRGDILAYRPEDLGPIDVLIGSPPCTEFSFANRGGGGDIEAGLLLAYRFLRFVYELQPRWWVMENVPRTLEYLPAEIPLRKLGIDKKGVFEMPVRAILLSADYGVPQKRARAFAGNFPIPKATHAEIPIGGRVAWRTLRDVVEALGDPEAPEPLGSVVRDPVYGFELPTHELTDHYSTTLRLTEEEARENRKAKEDHSWYGRMSFPDELDRPGRTVMATQLRVSRETTVIPARGGGFRRLSVREASSVQGFPITYQWWGKSEGLKYKLIGNAVAPPVAYAVAREILAAAGKAVPKQPAPYQIVHNPVPELALTTTRPRVLPMDRKFREHLPGSRLPGYRVDIDNQGKAPAPSPIWMDGRARAVHAVEWRAVLYRGSGKTVRADAVNLEKALRMLALTISDERSRSRARDFGRELAALAAEIPDATTLQAVRSERTTGLITPYALLDRLSAIVLRYFDSPQTVVHIASARSVDAVPRKVAAFLVAAAFACETANQGTNWAAAHPHLSFQPSENARQRIRSVDSSSRFEKAFERALRRYSPRHRRNDQIEEVEQLTTGA